MDIISELIDQRVIINNDLKKAFCFIKREDFLLPGDQDKANLNQPIGIGFGQTNSQPYTVAFMLESLALKPGDRVLDVGCGSGWTTALIAKVVGASGQVFGLEIIPELVSLSRFNVDKYNLLSADRVEIFLGDGWKGLPEKAPFDKIIVSAAGEKVPQALLDQLKIGGRLVLPVGKEFSSQDILVISKIGSDEYKKEKHSGFIFVPLVKK